MNSSFYEQMIEVMNNFNSGKILHFHFMVEIYLFSLLFSVLTFYFFFLQVLAVSSFELTCALFFFFIPFDSVYIFHVQFYSFNLVSFKTGIHKIQVGLQFTMQPKLAKSLFFSCYFLRAELQVFPPCLASVYHSSKQIYSSRVQLCATANLNFGTMTQGNFVFQINLGFIKKIQFH